MKPFLVHTLLLLSLPALCLADVTSKNLEIISGKSHSSDIRTATQSGTYIESMTIHRPKANTSADALARVNPHLRTLLRDYDKLIDTAQVSSRFEELYDRKISLLKRGSYPTEHNYCDCETILRLEHPTTGKIALWVQGDMDVVTDGSDPVRSPSIDDYDLARTSDWYLPETSYSWRLKSGDPKNPFLDYYPGTKKDLQEVRAFIERKAEKDPGIVWRDVLKSIDSQIYRVEQRGLKSYTREGLSQRRNLLATHDPFVVLPVPWVNKSAKWGPQIGDYAAVIYKDRIYPAILGDAGPSDKVGEASLRIARAINPEASGKNRAVEDVTVTYLFFPRSKEKYRSAPDYALWRSRVASLLDGIGGISSPAALHSWE